MKTPNYADAEFTEGIGWEISLDETTCSFDTLMYLERPDSERQMTMEEWDVLFAKRLAAGYYDIQKAEHDQAQINITEEQLNARKIERLKQYGFISNKEDKHQSFLF